MMSFHIAALQNEPETRLRAFADLDQARVDHALAETLYGYNGSTWTGMPGYLGLLVHARVADALSMELMRASPERQRVPAPLRPQRTHVPTRRHARAIEIFGQPGGFDPRFAP
jgi:hypothetical protein